MPKLPLGALSARMDHELAVSLTLEGKPPMNAVAMFGALREIMPAYEPPGGLAWPDDDALIAMTRTREPLVAASTLGTHEIQLWLGLMHVSAHLGRGLRLDAQQGERVLALLAVTPAPTDQGDKIRQRLLSWLEAAKAQGWGASL